MTEKSGLPNYLEQTLPSITVSGPGGGDYEFSNSQLVFDPTANQHPSDPGVRLVDPIVDQQPGIYPSFGGQIIQQPAHPCSPPATTVVVVNQEKQNKKREWTQSLFGCFDDCCICLAGTFAPKCLMLWSVSKLGFDPCEWFCLSCCFPTLFALRAEVRDRYNIEGSYKDDMIVSLCCSHCVNCQIAAEIENQRRHSE